MTESTFASLWPGEAKDGSGHGSGEKQRQYQRFNHFLSLWRHFKRSRLRHGKFLMRARVVTTLELKSILIEVENYHRGQQ